MLLSESVSRVIDLAGQVRAYYDRELPRYHRDYPIVHPDEAEPPVPPVEGELRAYLESLPGEMTHALLTMMDHARWGVQGHDLTGRYESLKEQYPSQDQAVVELLRQVPLADYLTDTLDELRRHEIDVDSLFLELSTT